MEKVNVLLRSLTQKYQANCNRMREIAAAMEAEQRDRTEAETAEYKALQRENEIMNMQIQALGAGAVVREHIINRDRELRETVLAGKKCKIELKREIQVTESLEGTGIIPVQEQELIKPLRAGLIYDKVGLKVLTGLTAGKLRWPKHGKAVAHFAGEGERLVDSNIDFDKLEVKPIRLGIAVPVSKEELESSEGLVDNVVREEMPAAIVDCINDALFSTTNTYTDGEGKTQTRKVVGPLVEAAKTAVSFAGAVPTRKELLKMKSQVTRSGIRLVAPCWVMTEDMKAELEDVKVDAGSGRFVCENDTIFGYPVFTTPAIGEGNIAFGDWSYQPAGFFGEMSLMVDPYTLARNNATDFILDSHFATATLYQEAFVLGQAKA